MLRKFMLTYTDNCCKRCSGPLMGEGGHECWAENQDQANAGQTFCDKCREEMEGAPKEKALDTPKPPAPMTPVDSLPLDPNVLAALIAADYTTVEKIQAAEDKTLTAIKGIGASTVKKIRETIVEMGIRSA